MLNQIILVGRVQDIKQEQKKVIATLSVPQSFKNISGEYEVNIIDVSIYGTIAETTQEYAKKGDLIGVKGRLQRLEKDKTLEVIAERVTFLSTRKEDEE